MGRRFFWFKFKDDFFQNLKIKKLRKIAGGDTYTIIYLKLMLLALKTDGYLYFEEVYETFAEELAEKIDEEIENVKLTLQYLLSVQLIELSEDGKTCYLKELKNCIGSESASTQRVRDYRERQKQQKALQCNAQPLQCNTDVTQALQCNTNVTEALQCNADVTQVKRVCNVEKRRVDIDIDINNSDINNNLLINNININKNKKEKEKEKEKKTSRHKFETCDTNGAKYLFGKIKGNNPKQKEPNFDNWAMNLD